MSKSLLAAVIIGSVLTLATMAASLYWILDSDASDVYLYAGAALSVLALVIGIGAGLAVAIRHWPR